MTTATGLQRYLSSGVLMIWGMTLTYFYFSGRVASYLTPAFQTGAMIAGIVMILLAFGRCFVVRDTDACCQGECAHVPKISAQLIGAAILVIPLICAAAISPNGFDASAIKNRGYVDNVAALPGYKPYQEPALPTDNGQASVPTSTPAPAAAATASSGSTVAASTDNAQQDQTFIPRNEAGQIKAQTIDLIYAAQEPSMRSDFENKDVEMIGQFMPARGNNPNGDRFDLVRMFMVCCAADARPVAVTIQTKSPEKVAEMSWVKVVGKATFPMVGGRMTPVVVASEVKPCDPPEDTFIY